MPPVNLLWLDIITTVQINIYDLIWALFISVEESWVTLFAELWQTGRSLRMNWSFSGPATSLYRIQVRTLTSSHPLFQMWKSFWVLAHCLAPNYASLSSHTDGQIFSLIIVFMYPGFQCRKTSLCSPTVEWTRLLQKVLFWLICP